jgi:hypothetical protein
VSGFETGHYQDKMDSMMRGARKAAPGLSSLAGPLGFKQQFRRNRGIDNVRQQSPHRYLADLDALPRQYASKMTPLPQAAMSKGSAERIFHGVITVCDWKSLNPE